MEASLLFAKRTKGRVVIGVDEAGRGPLAGPVVAAACVLGPGAPEGLDDSKKLSAKRRAALEPQIKASCHWALGVVEAVKAAGKAEQVAVFGTDGISDAYAAVRAGDLTGTVDSFPVLTGEIAMEVALRLMAGQDLPRVVATPQALITKENVETYATSDMAALRAALMAQ